MGLLKKIFKPVAKVLDKVVPNEIKPFLPYAAAVAPFMMPAGFGTGFASGLFKTQAAQQMAARALLGGGLNIAGQLSQEGSEGDINLLSAGLGALTGAMTAPGAADTFTGMTTASKLKGAPPGMFDRVMEGRSFLTQAKDLGLTGLAKGSEMFAAGIDKPFSMAGLKAASIPITQGTTDLAIAETRRLNKQQIIDDALSGLSEGFSNADASDAIRLAMLQYGFDDDEITETIAAAGYADGGRVGLMMGGSSDPDFSGIKGAVIAVDENMRADRAGDFFRLRDEAIQKGDDDKIKEIESDFFKEFGMVMPKTAKDGGLMDLGGKEMDLRKGGFVPIGKKERADDVPARLSKNEFVMTADAVRAAGGGSVNKGAKRMYDLMDRLEARA